MMKEFCRNLNEDPQKRDEVCKNIGNCIQDFVKQASEGNHFSGEDSNDYRGCNPKRAVVTQKPSEIIASKGKTVFVTITVKNDTKYPWRQGCYLNAVLNQSSVEIPRVVVDREVKGGDSFDLIVPVSLDAMTDSDQTKWDVQLAFYRNDGKQMGTPFVFNVVAESQDDQVL